MLDSTFGTGEASCEHAAKRANILPKISMHLPEPCTVAAVIATNIATSFMEIELLNLINSVQKAFFNSLNDLILLIASPNNKVTHGLNTLKSIR